MQHIRPYTVSARIPNLSIICGFLLDVLEYRGGPSPWGRDIAVVMPLDPSINFRYPVGWPHYNYDNRGRLWENPGFFTVLNGPIAREMIYAWNECPDQPERFPGCHKFRTSVSAELGAFANYIRYEYSNHIHEFPCTAGNGFPEMMTECRGVFVRHFTTDKSRVGAGATQSLARISMEILHDDILGKSNEIIEQLP